jgi:hypothetical protein
MEKKYLMRTIEYCKEGVAVSDWSIDFYFEELMADRVRLFSSENIFYKLILEVNRGNVDPKSIRVKYWNGYLYFNDKLQLVNKETNELPASVFSVLTNMRREIYQYMI